jgi:hypothetical protein
MRKTCDWCKKPVKKVGKLFKVDYLMLCKDCRKKYKAKKRDRKDRLVGRLKSIKRLLKFKRS